MTLVYHFVYEFDCPCEAVGLECRDPKRPRLPSLSRAKTTKGRASRAPTLTSRTRFSPCEAVGLEAYAFVAVEQVLKRVRLVKVGALDARPLVRTHRQNGKPASSAAAILVWDWKWS
jgi:hypothetical protein